MSSTTSAAYDLAAFVSFGTAAVSVIDSRKRLGVRGAISEPFTMTCQ